MTNRADQLAEIVNSVIDHRVTEIMGRPLAHHEHAMEVLWDADKFEAPGAVLAFVHEIVLLVDLSERISALIREHLGDDAEPVRFVREAQPGGAAQYIYVYASRALLITVYDDGSISHMPLSA